MKKRINIAELLKDCPTGMELDSPVWDNVVFEELDGDNIVIFRKGCGSKVYLTQHGELNSTDGKCIIFPKGKTTWEGFQSPFRDGDVLFVDASDGEDKCYQYIFILDFNNKHSKWQSYCYVCNDGSFSPYHTWLVEEEYQLRFATEEEKQKLFQAIKDNGYKWNDETKTLEKLIEPQFKVGDRIAHKNGITKPFTISQVGGGCYYATDKNAVGIMRIEDQDNYELVPNKFDITTLKPLQPVLVRNTNGQVWTLDFFSHRIDTNKRLQTAFVCVGHCTNQCIPYEGNEHLIGKADDCDNLYKTWP